MINLPAICVANGTAVLLLVIVMLSRRRNITYGLYDEKLYSLLMWLCVALCVSETVSFLIDGNTSPLGRILAPLSNSLNFGLNGAMVLVWTLYIDFKLFEDRQRLRRRLPLLALPAACIALGCVVNMFTPVFFSMSADNVYARTPMHLVPYAISYAYLAYGVVMVYSSRRKARRYLFLPVLVFIFPVLLASVLQYFFYGLSLLWLGTAIGIVSLYINVQNQASYIDPLSGVFNRLYLNQYLNAWAEQTDRDERLVGCMIDIDEFKSINDRWGHLMGDAVIARVGALLREVTAGSGFAARYGGDEFVLLQLVKKTGSVDKLLEDTKAQLTELKPDNDIPFPIKFSVGYSVFADDDTTDSFIKRIDTAMYKEKNRRVEQKLITDRRRRGGERS